MARDYKFRVDLEVFPSLSKVNDEGRIFVYDEIVLRRECERHI